jgi:hypothetical protein
MTDRPSICVRAILFTLVAKDPSENKYVEVFLLWLSQLIKCAELGPQDTLEILCDQPTLQYMKNTPFPQLMGVLSCKKMCIQLPQPRTLLQGCMWKYMLFDYSEDIFFYCDIDILIIKPLVLLFKEVSQNTLFAHIEGTLANPNFNSDLPKGSYISEEKGYSAGKFIITGKELRNRVFEYIQTLYSQNPAAPYFCLEQPFYNRALYDLKGTYTLNISLLNDDTICKNNTDYRKENCVLFDCNGIPGDDARHLRKISYAISLLNCGIY